MEVFYHWSLSDYSKKKRKKKKLVPVKDQWSHDTDIFLKILFALASKHLLMLIRRQGREGGKTKGLEMSAHWDAPGVRNFPWRKQDGRSVRPHSLSLLHSVFHTAVRSELLLPGCLESQSSVKKDFSVTVGDFPSEVRTSIHDSPLITVMIIGMSKDGHCCQWEMRVLILFWVTIWEVLSPAGFQRGGKCVRKQHARQGSHVLLPPAKTRPQDSIGGDFNSFYSSGQQDSWFNELGIRILSLENWFLTVPGGYD